jgi:hypothetical protein
MFTARQFRWYVVHKSSEPPCVACGFSAFFIEQTACFAWRLSPSFLVLSEREQDSGWNDEKNQRPGED